MTSRDHRWDELQTRWARGDHLSPEEEQERLAHTEHDALARRELELFAELRARGAAPEEPVAPALIGRALEALKGSPRLRLVTTTSEGGPRAPEPPAPRSRVARIAVSGLLLAAASAFALFAVALHRRAPRRHHPRCGRHSLRASPARSWSLRRGKCRSRDVTPVWGRTLSTRERA